jgi:4'-phosphopantetheinyl transferase
MPLEALQRDQVHVWTIERDRDADIARLSRWLSPEEQRRASRLKVTQRREAFIYNRALLRSILASYSDLAPDEVPLSTTAEGKPIWDDPCGLSFNLAHSGDLAILAVAAKRPVGIDLEAVDQRAHYETLAKQGLSPRELQIFVQLPESERTAAILRIWTRKEAFLKAVGVGLARPLDEIEVTFLPTEMPRILATGDPGQAANDWLLESWSPRPGWFAALATPRESGSLHLRFHHATSLTDHHASPLDRETQFRESSDFDEKEQKHVA